MKSVEIVQKSALDVAGDSLKRDTLLRLGAMMGATIAIDEIVSQLDAKRIELAKQTRDSRLWEQAGYESWEACCTALFGPKRTVNRHIKELDEQGPDFLGISAIVRVGKPAWALMDVHDGEIIFNGERIAITKANEQKIKEVVAYYREQASTANAALDNRSKAAEIAQTKAKVAEKKAAKAQEALAAYENPLLTWPKSDDPDHARLLQMQVSLDLICSQLRGFASRDVSPESQAKVIAFAKYAWAEIHQAGELACNEYGVGMNAPVPAEWLTIDAATQDRRNLVAEYIKEHVTQ